MARKLRIIYYVEPDVAALARRAAQYFVEMADEAVDARGRARIAISGGSTPKAAFELLGDPGQPWRARRTPATKAPTESAAHLARQESSRTEPHTRAESRTPRFRSYGFQIQCAG